MEVESALLAELAEFIGYIKSNRSVVDAAEGGAAAAMRDESFLSSLQVLRSEAPRGKQEVLELDAAAVASSARRFLKALFVCCAEADRLTRAAVGERGLGGAATETDDDMDVDGAQDDDMDVDGRLAAPGARRRQEESGRVSAGSAVAAVLFPSSGAKRKRACASAGGEVDTARPHKRRRLLAWWMRPCPLLPSGSGRVSSARKVALARSRIRRPIGKPDARTVAMAIQRRTGKPTTARHRPKPSLGLHFSRISL